MANFTKKRETKSAIPGDSMRIFRRAAMVAIAAGSLSCAQAQEAGSIEYGLAETRLKIAVSIILESCSAVNIVMTPTLTITPEAIRSMETNRIESGELVSRIRRREVAIALHETGALKSVNATTENRVAAIVGGIFKLAASFSTGQLLNVDTPLPDPCAPVRNALDRVTTLKTRIENMQQLISRGTPLEIAQAQAAVDGLAKDIAALKTGALHLELKRTAAFGAGEKTREEFRADPCGSVGGTVHLVASVRRCLITVRWEPSAFSKWFGFALVGGIRADAKAAQMLALTIDLGEVPMLDTTSSVCKRSCPTIVIREPAIRSVTVTGSQGSEWTNGSPLATLQVPIGQWGQSALLPLKASFGQTRTTKLELDQFGRKTAFSWGTNAAMEGVVGGLADAAGAATAYMTTTASPTLLQQQQAEVTELETLQKLNKLRACEETIRAGGHVCPP